MDYFFLFLLFGLISYTSAQYLRLFVSPEFAFLNENFPVGSDLPNVHLCASYDGSKPLRLAITNGDNYGHFRIQAYNDTCWTLALRKALDADQLNLDGTRGQTFSLTFRCTDSQVQTFANLDIQIIDINDKAPLFVDTENSVSISENSEMGSKILTVTTVDPDTGVGGINSFRLENDFEGAFRISEGSCSNSRCQADLFITKQLSYSIKNSYRLHIIATDGAGRIPENNTAKFAVVVNVLDVQNSPPRFTTDNRIQYVKEDAQIGTQVFQVTATDGDTGASNANTISYHLVSPSTYFDINSESGWVFVVGKLDREDSELAQNNGATYLTVEAVEEVGVDPKPSTIMNLTVLITDVDDEPPRCAQPVYKAQILENSQFLVPLTLIDITEIYVFDKDAGDKGQFELTLVGPDASAFDVSPKVVYQEATLILRVKDATAIDYEVRKEMKFKILLQPKPDSIMNSTSCDVTVEILDANDNAPVFSTSNFTGSVRENGPVGTSVMQISAYDNDTTKYDPLIFVLNGPGANFFAIGKTGIIRTTIELDREKMAAYFLTVTVTDEAGSGKRISAPLEIYISDENDNAPYFEKKIYTVFLLENSQVFTQLPNGLFVKAVDLDESGSQNSNITYYLESEQEWIDNFTLNRITGQIVANHPGLDRELLGNDHVNLTIIARDNGNPSLSGQTLVTVYVNDSNDNAPVFERTSYNVSIPENATSGDFVVKVHADDKDKGQYNKRIIYRIDDVQDKFVINSDTGVISVATGTSLDLESSGKGQYHLTILAVDQGFPSLNGHTKVNVNIRDINNKMPSFSQKQYQLAIPEHSETGTSVLNLTASDPDKTAILQYKIITILEATTSDGKAVNSEKYDYTSLFGMEPKTGELYLKKQLDREEMQFVSIKVGVLDINGVVDAPQTGEAIVKITVLDSNDNAPKFSKPLYLARVPENAPEGSAIVTVTASDPDTGSFGIRYGLNSEGNGLVAIDAETGEITVAGNIDYEKVKWINITVTASDKDEVPKTSEVAVNIRVLDQNDNSPVFVPSSTYTVTVAENSEFGLPLIEVSATDKDSGSFGEVSYFLLSETDDPTKQQFEINIKTGQISLKRGLDREKRERYSLTVRAIDDWNGKFNSDSHEATAVVEVIVSDVNDSPPKFATNIPKELVLNENDETGSHVATFSASDPDDATTPNAKIEYFITGGNATAPNGDPMFSLNPENGVVTLARNLNGMFGFYTLVIEARDAGSPRQATNVSISVKVTDYNDHKPKIIFPTPHSSHYITENNYTQYLTILKMEAIDNDQGNNADLWYEIKESKVNQDWKYFSMDSISGEIYPKQALDYEKQQKYALTVTVCDRGTPPQCAEVEFFIELVDQNDHCPYFERSEEYVNIVSMTENNEGSTQVGKFLEAKDADTLEENRIICYQIVARDPINAPFYLKSIHETQLMTNRSLDREFLAEYVLVVQATDCGENADCETVVPASGIYSASDNSLLLVRILVEDENDNPPRFTQRLFLGGGVQGDTKIGTRVARVRAVDLDSSDDGRLQYSVPGDIKVDLLEGTLETDRQPFYVNSTTGDVITNIVFQPEWKGSFHFTVTAADTNGQEDYALVTINLLSYDQQVELLFESPANKIWDEAHEIIRLLSEITNTNATIDDVRAHQTILGNKQTESQSSVLVHFVGGDEQVLPISEALRALDMPITSSERTAKQQLINVHRLRYAGQNADPIGSRRAQYNLYFALAAIIGGLVLVMLVLICLWCIQNHRYKRKLKAANTFAFGSSDMMTATPFDVPGTNLHSSSNPVWTGQYGPMENYGLEFDRTSRNSLDENEVNLTEKKVDAITSRTLSTGPRHNGFLSTAAPRFSANYAFYGSDTVAFVSHSPPQKAPSSTPPEPPNYPSGSLESTEL